MCMQIWIWTFTRARKRSRIQKEIFLSRRRKFSEFDPYWIFSAIDSFLKTPVIGLAKDVVFFENIPKEKFIFLFSISLQTKDWIIDQVAFLLSLCVNELDVRLRSGGFLSLREGIKIFSNKRSFLEHCRNICNK